MRVAERLELITRVLRDRPGITAGALAEALGVSVRSVFRDIARLRDRGVPVEGGRGRGGGLGLPGTWGVGRVLLSTEEALGVLMSLAISESLAFPLFGPGLARARRTVLDAFPQHERRRLAPLRERVLVGPSASPAVRASYATPVSGVLRPLQDAFVRGLCVTATYARGDGVTRDRLIEPHALLINWPAWYVLGVDRERSAARTFRLDRFRTVSADPAAGFRPDPRGIARAALGDPAAAPVQSI